MEPTDRSHQGLCGIKYVSEEGARKLLEYKYAGGDNGFLWRIFYNPLALKLTSMLPMWIAPNLITLVGFMFTVIPLCVLFGIYGATFDEPAPRWFCFAEAFFYFMYRILDEMDGKQARRTGNSSPLGLIFDHGCDAFSSVFMPMIMARILMVGNNVYLMLVLATVCLPFYFATLEEYYTGGLFLGLGNGVTDGSAAIYAVFIATGFLGSEFWAQDTGFELLEEGQTATRSQLVFCVFFATQVFASMWYVVCIVRDRRKKAEEWSQLQASSDIEQQRTEMPGEPLEVWALVQQSLGYILITAVTFVCILDSDHPVLKEAPVLPVLLYGFIFVHLTISIQVAHVTKQKFLPWKVIVMIDLVALFANWVAGRMLEVSIREDFFFAVLLLIHCVLQAHFIVCVIAEFTQILNIRVFRVKPVNIESTPLKQIEMVTPQLNDTDQPEEEEDQRDSKMPDYQAINL